LRAGEDIERDEFEDAAGGAEGGIQAALITDRTRIAFDDGGEAHGLAADEIDGGGVGEDLADAADDAAAEDNGGADDEVEIFAFADGETLPPAGEIAADDAGVFGAVAGVSGETEDGFEAGDLALHLGVLLDGEFVGGVEAGEVASGLDELGVGVETEGPVFLEVAGIGGGDTDGGGELEEGGAGEDLEDRGDHQPRGDEKTEREERTGLVETFGHGAAVKWWGRYGPRKTRKTRKKGTAWIESRRPRDLGWRVLQTASILPASRD